MDKYLDIEDMVSIIEEHIEFAEMNKGCEYTEEMYTKSFPVLIDMNEHYQSVIDKGSSLIFGIKNGNYLLSDLLGFMQRELSRRKGRYRWLVNNGKEYEYVEQQIEKCNNTIDKLQDMMFENMIHDSGGQ